MAVTHGPLWMNPATTPLAPMSTFCPFVPLLDVYWWHMLSVLLSPADHRHVGQRNVQSPVAGSVAARARRSTQPSFRPRTRGSLLVTSRQASRFRFRERSKRVERQLVVPYSGRTAVVSLQHYARLLCQQAAGIS